MAIEWYVHDPRGQHGPFRSTELRHQLSGYPNTEGVFVWRQGFQEWIPAADIFDPVGGSIAANIKESQVKARWSLYGAILGLALCAADFLFEWRGKKSVVWQGDAAENIGYILGTVGTAAALFFVAGAIKDHFSSRKNARSKLDPTTFAAAENTPPSKASNRRFTNFVARNWRGEFPLWVTYWVFGLVGNIAILAVTLALASINPSQSVFRPISVFWLIISVWLCIVAVSVWQWVGVWRASSKQVKRRALQRRKAPWAWAAKFVIIIAFMRLGYEIFDEAMPQIREISRIAFLDDPDIPQYSIRVMRSGTEAEITGGIKFGLAADFSKILRASRQIRVVHLNSIGGRIGEGEQLYKVIKDNNLTTYVSAECLSACTLAFSAGRERVLKNGAVLGFHRGSFAGEELEDTPELEGQRKIFTAAGYDPQFIGRALATRNADMWKPAESELLNAGVITRISKGSDYAFSGFPPDVSKVYFFNLLAQTAEVYAAIRDRFPKRYDEMVELYYRAVIDGMTEAETTTKMYRHLTATLSVLRPLAADDVLVDLGNFYADQLGMLQKQSDAVCYEYARSGLGAGIIPALADRELNLEARIVRTASQTSDTSEPSRELWTKVFNRWSARGVSEADMDLIEKVDVQDNQQSRYCAVMIVLYKEITALPQAEAARLIRYLIAAK